MNRMVRTIGLAVLFGQLSAGCAALTEGTSLERQTQLAEKRELWAFKQQACEDAINGAWMCSSGNKAAQKVYPWAYCACVDNQRVLE